MEVDLVTLLVVRSTSIVSAVMMSSCFSCDMVTMFVSRTLFNRVDTPFGGSALGVYTQVAVPCRVGPWPRVLH